MRLFSEIFVLEYLPRIRALIAFELVVNLGHTQEEASRIMGLKQPTISNYILSERKRKKVNIEPSLLMEIKRSANELALGTQEPHKIYLRLRDIVKKEYEKRSDVFIDV